MLLPFFRCLVSVFKSRREPALENLALRQQLAVRRRSVKRPRLSDFDRTSWGPLIQDLEGLEAVAVPRETGDSYPVAPLRFQTLSD